MDQNELKSRSNRTRTLIVSALSQKSSRDRQKTLGPSDLSDHCEFCVGEKILVVQRGAPLSAVKKRFSYAAWVGTAIHEKLDRDLGAMEDRVFTERELTLKIADIPAVGTVWGHTDCYVPGESEVIDFKTKLDKQAVDKLIHLEELFRTEGVVTAWLERMWDQTMLYGLGAEKSGRSVEAVTLVVLPRYSDDTDEIKAITRRYDRSRALGVIDRVTSTAEKLRIVGVTGLTFGTGCYYCEKQRV